MGRRGTKSAASTGSCVQQHMMHARNTLTVHVFTFATRRLGCHTRSPRLTTSPHLPPSLSFLSRKASKQQSPYSWGGGGGGGGGWEEREREGVGGGGGGGGVLSQHQRTCHFFLSNSTQQQITDLRTLRCLPCPVGHVRRVD